MTVWSAASKVESETDTKFLFLVPFDLYDVGFEALSTHELRFLRVVVFQSPFTMENGLQIMF